MKKPLIIGLHGAPRTGKTTVCKILSFFYGFDHHSISMPIKNAAESAVEKTFRDKDKDIPQDVLDGKTPRELYIAFGNLDDIFHSMWVRQIFNMIETDLHEGYRSHVIESIGKQHQWNWLIDNAKGFNLLLVKMTRPGHTYEAYNDSRSDILPNGIRHDTISNCHGENIEHLESEVSALLSRNQELMP